MTVWKRKKEIMYRFFILCSLFLVVLAPFPSISEAHAYLLSSNPPNYAVLKQAPNTITLKFSEQLNPDLISLKMVGSNHQTIPIEAKVDPHDPHVMYAKLPKLANGSYDVNWNVISEDGHPVSGTISFSIGQAFKRTGGESVTSNLISISFLIILRYIAETIILIGAGLALMSFFGERYGLPSFDQLVKKRWKIIGAMSLFACMILLWYVYSSVLPDHVLIDWLIGGKWSLFWQVPFAVMLLVQFAILLLLILPNMVSGWYLFFWFCLVTSLAFGGHAWSSRPVFIALLSRVIHLSMGAIWLGGLAYLGLLLIRKTEIEQLRTFRPFFYQLGLVASSLVFVSGLSMVLMQTNLPAVVSFHTAWSLFLTMKFLFYLMMVIYAMMQATRWKKENGLRLDELRSEWFYGLLVLFLGVWMSQIAYPLPS
jgi:copper transport protein